MKNNCLNRKKKELPEIKNRTGLKQGVPLQERKQMQFEKENVACVIHTPISHSTQNYYSLD